MKALPKLISKSLATQSVWMISIFLICELFFGGILWFQVFLSQKELTKQAQLIEVLRKTLTLVTDLNDYEFSIGTWLQDRTDERKQVVLAYQEKMNNDLDWLKEHLKHDRELSKQLDDVMTRQSRVFRAVDRVMDRLAKIENQQQAILLGVTWYKNPRNTHERMEWQGRTLSLLKSEEKLLDAFPVGSRKRSTEMRSVIFLGLALNFALILLLCLAFASRIRGRLMIMLDNTRRIARREDLNPVIDGSDELALLDQSMHQMSEAIDLAQKERQSFLAVVSHELRTPLASIIGPLDLLTMGVYGDLGNDSESKILFSQNELGRLLSLINDLLDLEKLESAKLQMSKKIVYLDAAIEKAVEQYQSLADESGVELVAEESDREVTADVERLAQSLAILIHNAIKNSKRGSTVEIKVNEKAEFVEIQVLDRADGLPESLIPQLFNRFRKNADENGSIMKGMGLPIARYIVEAHDGKIGYLPREGGGSVFWIKLNTVSA